MIRGIGTDIVNIARIEAVILRYGERFLQRIFTSHERDYCDGAQGQRRIIRYANRYAAKEACLKAIGVKHGISWQHIEVQNAANGKPYLRLYGAAHQAAHEAVNVEENIAGGQVANVASDNIDVAEGIIARAGGQGRDYRLHLSLSDDYPYATAFVVLE